LSRSNDSTVWGVDRTGPAWAARAYERRRGQDHLGLGSVSSDRILPALSPGINVLTIHPRYWSLYAYLLDEFWNTRLPRSKAGFTSFYRPREALFAFACQLCDAPEHDTVLGNIVGSQRTAGPARELEAFDPHFEYIKEPLGGYGLYYRSAMEMTGVLVTTDAANGLPFDALTPVGKALAEAYRQAVADTALVREHLTTNLEDLIPRETLRTFARAGCLCQLRRAEDQDRPLLQDLFLHAGAPLQSGARRATLRFLLDLCTTANDAGLDQDRFRQLIYFRSLDDDTYRPRRGIEDAARRWRLYQAREYFAFVFNRLWAWLARRGLDLSDDGLVLVPMARVWDLLRSSLDSSDFTGLLGVRSRAFRADTRTSVFASWLTRHVDVTGGVTEVWPRHPKLDEHALYRWCHNTDDDPETLLAMIAVLLLVHRRVGTPQRLGELAGDRDIVAEGTNRRIGMAGFFGAFNRKLMSDPTLFEVLEWLMSRCVIPQHERVALAKLPDDTFRFRRLGENMRFFHHEAPVRFNDSRFDAISTVVHELGLVSSVRDPRRRLSAASRELLRTGDLPAGALAEAAAMFEPDASG
jgi:hypothetical protein